MTRRALENPRECMPCRPNGAGAEIPSRFVCPISLEVMAEPVMCRNGHNFERDALAAWVRGHGSCPTCRVEIPTVADLYPNLALRENIAEWWSVSAQENQGSAASSSTSSPGHGPPQSSQRVLFVDSRTGNLLTFTTRPGGFLQYTVNGSNPRPPFRSLLFEGQTVHFLDIHKSAALPVSGWSGVVCQMLEIAAEVGIRPVVQFTDPETKNELAFTAVNGGWMQYTVNGAERPPFKQMLFEGARVRFPDIDRSATLPANDWEYVLEEILQLVRMAGVQPAVQFVDPETTNELTFTAMPEGSLHYTVNGKDPRPPFRQLWFEGSKVKFSDIERSATLPTSDWSFVVEQMLLLAKACGIEPTVRFTDPETKNKLAFKAVPDGCLQYTVNGTDPRPPFRQLKFDEGKVKFLDINRSATLPTRETYKVCKQLMSLGKLADLQIVRA